MKTTKEILTETLDTVNEWSQCPNNTCLEKLQYKVMRKNLNCMLKGVLWLEKMKKRIKSR